MRPVVLEDSRLVSPSIIAEWKPMEELLPSLKVEIFNISVQQELDLYSLN
jgi:hypothetical protein